VPDSWLLAEESCQTGNDEQEVAGGSDHRERQVRSRKLTRLQQDPELFNPGLDERRNEQVDVVPKCGDMAIPFALVAPTSCALPLAEPRLAHCILGPTRAKWIGNCGDYAASAEPPCAISASEHDDREIDQRLKRVEKTDLWVKDR